MSKITQFDKVLDGYFAKLELDKSGGQWRVCKFSGEKFYVRPEDIEFYKKIRVPLPTLRPEERRRKRCAAHNSYTLFKKTSAYSGKKIISIHSPSSPYKIYEHQVWYSDKWEPFEYGRPYDQNNSFFDQFHKLELDIPHPSLITDPSNVNSDYTNVSRNLKNCYFTFDQNGGEDLYYHQCCWEDKNCIDCWALDFSDTCYDSKIGDHLFKCFFCEEVRNCTESYFLWDGRHCDYCFMSSNLRHKKYYFRNQYIGKEEYERRMREINFGNFEALEKLKQEFRELKLQASRKPTGNEKSIDVFGDYIVNSKNIYFGLWVWDSENLAYSEGATNSRDSYDVLGGVNNELCYEVSNVWADNNYGVKFSTQVDNCREVEYCNSLSNCRNCFGCVGLSNKQFCILNKQYAEDEYWKIMDSIKTKMLVDGEYGEFFPPQYFLFPYRTTTVEYYQGFQDYNNAKKYGYDISPVPEEGYEVLVNMITASDLPNDIRDVADDILEKIIIDKHNKKFRIIKQELDFYRKHNLSLPRENPADRMTSWRKDLGLVVNFYERKCAKCGKDIISVYAHDRPEKNIYCETCYQNALV